MSYERRKIVDAPEERKKTAKVIEFPRNSDTRQTVVYCSNCKKRFPNGRNFNFCPDCGRSLTTRPH